MLNSLDSVSLDCFLMDNICCATLQWLAAVNLCIVDGMPGGMFLSSPSSYNATRGRLKRLGAEKATLGMAAVLRCGLRT